MVSPQNTLESYSTPSEPHHTAEGYDADLLARAPQLTREQRLEGYDETLLNRGPTSSNSPNTARRGGMPLGAALPTYPGSHAETVEGDDGLPNGGMDGRGLYSAVGIEKGLRTPKKEYSNDDIESAPAATGRKPWYKRRVILLAIVALIAIIAIAVAVPVAVTNKSSSNKNTSNNTSSRQDTSTSFDNVTPAPFTASVPQNSNGPFQTSISQPTPPSPFRSTTPSGSSVTAAPIGTLSPTDTDGSSSTVAAGPGGAANPFSPQAQ